MLYNPSLTHRLKFICSALQLERSTLGRKHSIFNHKHHVQLLSARQSYSERISSTLPLLPNKLVEPHIGSFRQWTMDNVRITGQQLGGGFTWTVEVQSNRPCLGSRVSQHVGISTSAYFEPWDMPFVVSNVLPESDLVPVGLDWFTSYHDVRLRRPSEGQIHIEPPRVVENT